MNKAIILIIILVVAFMFSSSIGAGIWFFRDDLFGTPEAPSTNTNTRTTTGSGGPTGSGGTTLNGVSFDSSGYTVGKGKIWNRNSLQTSGYSKSTTPGAVSDWYGKTTTDADACRKDCVDRSACTHFGRDTNNNRCYLFTSDGDTETDNGYIRGFKNAPGKLYTPLAYLDEILETKTNVTTQECKNSCTNKTGCLAWTSQVTGSKSCELRGNVPNVPASFEEGAVGR